MGPRGRAADLRRCEDRLRQVSGPVASSSYATCAGGPATSFAARKTGFRRER